MKNVPPPSSTPNPQSSLEQAYRRENPRFLARLRAAGRGWEEAEDLVHDVYLETLERLPFLPPVRNVPAWLTSLVTRRMIDLWRHDKVRYAAGERDAAEETFAEVLAEAGFDPLDAFVRESLVDALDEAVRALPSDQREVLEAQVYQGETFRELAARTGVSIDTLTARKRAAVQRLARALRHWVED